MLNKRNPVSNKEEGEDQNSKLASDLHRLTMVHVHPFLYTLACADSHTDIHMTYKTHTEKQTDREAEKLYRVSELVSVNNVG